MESSPRPTATEETPAETGSKPLWSRPTFETLPLEQTLNSSTITPDSTSDQES